MIPLTELFSELNVKKVPQQPALVLYQLSQVVQSAEQEAFSMMWNLSLGKEDLAFPRKLAFVSNILSVPKDSFTIIHIQT